MTRKLVKKTLPMEEGKISKQELIKWIAQAPEQIPLEGLGQFLEGASKGQFKLVKKDEIQLDY